jgi:serine/threonine protein kinase
MFPLASSNLEYYWESNPGPYKEDIVRAEWLFQQCVGIANALSTVHRYITVPKNSYLYHASHTIKNSPGDGRRGTAGEPIPNLFGRHGDIKPSNILVFADPASVGGYGTLKITRFSTEDRRSVIEGSRITNSAIYRSPECDIPGSNISTACDVWALGCVYLMLTTWFFRGNESLTVFLHKLQQDTEWYEKECFFTTYRDAINGTKKARVKPCVTKVIKDQPHLAVFF